MMNNVYRFLFILGFLSFGAVIVVGSAEVTFTDSVGETITLPHSVERVIGLNSDAAEAMVVLGSGDKVIGITESTLSDSALMSHLPNAVSVGNWQTPSVERILELKPDAVISYSSSKPKNADQLEAAGVNLIYLDFYKFNTLKHDISAIGTMIGGEEKADEYISFMKKWEDEVTSRIGNISGEEMPTAYIEGYSEYSAQGKDSGIDILMNLAGGKNLAASLGEQWPKVTPEWVITENPSVIIKTASVKPDKTLEQVREDVLTRPGFESLNAIKEKNVYVLNGELIYGPRSPAGLMYLAKALHPEEFSDVNPDDVLKQYADNFVSGMEEGDYFAPLAF